VLEAAESVGAPGSYARFCMWPSEKSPSACFGEESP
jgi:hypothetical protein